MDGWLGSVLNGATVCGELRHDDDAGSDERRWSGLGFSTSGLEEMWKLPEAGGSVTSTEGDAGVREEVSSGQDAGVSEEWQAHSRSSVAVQSQ